MKRIRSITFWLGCLLLALTAGSGPVAAAPTTTLAVADFTDESHDGAVIGATRLSEDLVRFLVAREADQFAVVPVEQTREAMRRTGFTLRDLIYPSRAAAVAQAAGAQWIVIGRWTRLELDRENNDPTVLPLMRWTDAYATVQIRVLEAGSRRILLEETFSSSSIGDGGLFLLRQAARGALRRAATRIMTLQPPTLARTP